MPIDIPRFPIQQVPTPQPQEPSVIPQQPFVDPAGIIMQAAQLKQQRDLATQQLQMEAIKNLTTTIQTAQSLREKKREADMENAVSLATLGLHKNQIGAESALWAAHAKSLEAQSELFKAQAQMYSGGNTGYLDSMQKVHAGTMDPDTFFGGFSSRSGMKASMINLYNQTYPGDNISNLKAKWLQKQESAKVAGGPSVQIAAAMAKGVEALSQDLANKGQALGLTRYPLINKAIIAYKTSIGDPGMSDYLLTNMEAQKQLSQVFQAGGSPTDFAQKSAAETMRPENGPDAMRQITAQTIPTMIGARLGALGSIGVVGQQGMPGGQIQMTPQMNPNMTGPKIRVIRKSDGMQGTIDPHDYDGDKYQIAQ